MNRRSFLTALLGAPFLARGLMAMGPTWFAPAGHGRLKPPPPALLNPHCAWLRTNDGETLLMKPLGDNKFQYVVTRAMVAVGVICKFQQSEEAIYQTLVYAKYAQAGDILYFTPEVNVTVER
jgi:hypothetical protein